MQGAIERTPKPVDMFNKTKLPEGEPGEDTNASREPVMSDPQTEADKRRHEAAIKEAEKRWRKLAAEKNWDAVIPNLEVYQYAGVNLTTDPRRTEEYREKVLEAVKFGK